jgi:hypothetical protein
MSHTAPQITPQPPPLQLTTRPGLLRSASQHLTLAFPLKALACLPPPPTHTPPCHPSPIIPRFHYSRIVCALEPSQPRPVPLLTSGTIVAKQSGSGATVSTVFTGDGGSALAWADNGVARLLPVAWTASPTLVSEAIFYGATRYARKQLFGGGRPPCPAIPPSATATATSAPLASATPSPSSTPSASTAAAAAAAAVATAEATIIAVGSSVAALFVGLVLGVAATRSGSAFSSWLSGARAVASAPTVNPLQLRATPRQAPAAALPQPAVAAALPQPAVAAAAEGAWVRRSDETDVWYENTATGETSWEEWFVQSDGAEKWWTSRVTGEARWTAPS